MLEPSLRLGTVAGIRIGLHYTWFVIFALLSFSLYVVFLQGYGHWSRAAALSTAVITAVLFFVSILLHELAHSVVALARGIPVRSITLFIFGGMAQTERESDSAATEFWVAIAGPAMSLALAALCYLLRLIVGPYSETAAVTLQWLVSINLVVAIFNLVPGFPLDGGRVFRALIWGATGDADKGMRWAVGVGKVVAYALMGLGVIVVLRGHLLLNGLWLFGIGWFLLTAAEASRQSFSIQRMFQHLTARAIMQTDPPTVAAALSVADWIDEHVLTTGQRAFLVTDAGELTGLITLSDCRRVPRDRWADTAVRDIMTPLARLHEAAPDTPVTSVLQLMQSYGLNQVPIIERGQVLGWIDRDRLLKIIRLHGETGR